MKNIKSKQKNSQSIDYRKQDEKLLDEGYDIKQLTLQSFDGKNDTIIGMINKDSEKCLIRYPVIIHSGLPIEMTDYIFTSNINEDVMISHNKIIAVSVPDNGIKAKYFERYRKMKKSIENNGGKKFSYIPNDFVSDTEFDKLVIH